MNNNTETSNRYFKFYQILFCLLPLALVSGPFFSDLIISIIGLFFFYLIISNKKINFFKNKYVIFFFIFYFYILFRSLFSENILLSLESSLFYFRYLFFIFGAAYLIAKYPKTIKYFKASLFITISVLIADSYYQYFVGENILGYIATEEGRVSSFFNDELVLGHFLCRMMPLLFGLIAISKKIKTIEILLAMLLFLLTDVLIFISGDRTAFVLLFISTIIIICLISRFKFIRLTTFIISLIIITSITLLDNTVKNRVIDTTFDDMIIDQDDRVVAFSETHEAIYMTSWKMFLDNPFFGQGPKMFRELCSKDQFLYKNGCSTHPHNTYLQLLAETGLIGFLMIFLIFVYLTYLMIRQLFSLFFDRSKIISDHEVCLIAAIYIFLWPLAPSFNFFNNWISIIHFLPLCFLIKRDYLLQLFNSKL